MTQPKTKDGFEVYRSGLAGDKKWYWRLRRRGRVIADGSEAYTRQTDGLRAVRGVSRWLKGAVPIFVTDPNVLPGRKR